MVSLKEQSDIVSVMTGRFKPDSYFTLKTIKNLLKKQKAFLVVRERPRRNNNFTIVINDKAVVLELRNINSYKIHFYPPLFLHCCLHSKLVCVITHIKTSSVN